jgi:hypothetical protein
MSIETGNTSNKIAFDNKVELLRDKKLNIDKYENIQYIEGDDNGLIKAVRDYKLDNTADFLAIFARYFIYNIKKTLLLFTENFMYQFNEIYDKPYTYYHVFLNICFITLIIILSLILYWDNVYRCARERSRCSDIKSIMQENSVSSEPYLYGVMIIHKKHLDQLKDKFVLVIVYDFERKSTRIEYGEEKYLKEVYPTNISTSMKFRYYDIAQNTFQNISEVDAEIITNDYFQYIPINSKNEVLNTQVARNLAHFVRDYAKNRDTLLHPVYDIMNAYEQKYNNVNI